MSANPLCPFCRIAAGAAPASIVHEDDALLAFLDIGPVNPGHALVIPRAHHASLAELPLETGAAMFRLAMRLASALRASGIRCEGVSLMLSDGEAAGQEVRHCHLHVVPRFTGDAFRITADWSSPTRRDLDAVAAQLRAVQRSANRP